MTVLVELAEQYVVCVKLEPGLAGYKHLIVSMETSVNNDSDVVTSFNTANETYGLQNIMGRFMVCCVTVSCF